LRTLITLHDSVFKKNYVVCYISENLLSSICIRVVKSYFCSVVSNFKKVLVLRIIHGILERAFATLSMVYCKITRICSRTDLNRSRRHKLCKTGWIIPKPVRLNQV